MPALPLLRPVDWRLRQVVCGMEGSYQSLDTGIRGTRRLRNAVRAATI